MTTATLKRTTFRTNREMDFFSEKELITQTGHSREEWPFVMLKELIDNALDACEEADITPNIEIAVDACGITVRDNGPGIPVETIEGSLDFTVRISNRDVYVAPDRGAQGNALKTLLSIPRILNPDVGKIVITSHGIRHEITCRADAITQRPIIERVCSPANGRIGTEVRIQWAEPRDKMGSVPWPFDGNCPASPGSDEGPDAKDKAMDLIWGYAFFNPHLSLNVQWFGKEILQVEATDAEWKKWRPNQPTSPHWYEARHLERLIAAYITHDRELEDDRTVAAFLAEFDGLTSSRKRRAVLEETELARVNLSALATEDGLRSDLILRLLASMKKHTRPVTASRLGVIGKKHIAKRLVDMGGDAERCEYTKVARVDEGVAFVLETAFAWLGNDAPDKRRIFAGANWSTGIKNPFRSFGQTGEGLGEVLQEQRAGVEEPIMFLIHLAHPRIEYTDRGKSAIVIE